MQYISTESYHSRSGSHIYGLDGLRTLAILGVFLYHMFPAVASGGFLGVSLFFTLTGYLMFISCHKAWQKNQFHILSFYQKRLRRIYPALLLTLLLTLFTAVYLLPDAARSSWQELSSILLGYNNWWQIAQDASYFTKITNASPFTHLWFLSIELQFYLIWPLFFLLYQKAKGKSGKGWIFLILLFLSIISGILMAFLYEPGQDPSRVYYGTDTRIFSLLLGVCLGMWQQNRPLQQELSLSGKKMRTGLAFLCLLATLVLFFCLDGQHPVTYQGGMFLVNLLFILLLALVSDNRLAIGRLLEHPALSWLGRYSYEIYLCQYPILFYFNFLGYPQTVWYWALLQIVLTLLLAVLLHTITTKSTSLLRQLNGPIARWLRVTAVILLLTLSGCTLTSIPFSSMSGDEKQLQQELDQNRQQLENRLSDMFHANEQPVSKVPWQKTPMLLSQEVFKRNFPQAPEGTITVVGDSVMLGASPALQELLPDSIIDAKESRQLTDCIPIVQQLNSHGQLGDIVILEAGTNGPFKTEDGQKLLDYLGPNRTIYWVNTYGKHLSWQQQVNTEIRDLAGQYSNLHIIDWASIAPHHPEWFYHDGIHLNSDGQKAYAQFVVTSIQ